MPALQSVFGFCVLVFAAWTLSEQRARIPWKTVAGGLALQFVLALLLLKTPASREVFLLLNHLMLALQDATRAGTTFVFGYLGGAKPPFEEASAGSSFILAFQALPLVLVVSALSAVLFYWRVLPVVVRGFSALLQKTMNVGGAVGVSAAANIFVGMVEAPLFIRPYLKDMDRGELFVVMTCGMATMLDGAIPAAMGHLLTASVISAPAAIVIAVLMVPPQASASGGSLVPPQQADSTMDAVTSGTFQGVQLLLNIVAMLVVLVALVSLVNQILGLLPDIGDTPITLQRLLGYALAPFVWLLGIPWSEAPTAGALMGTKIVLNELIAYLDLADLPEQALAPRSRLIMTYAMCGFANFGSLGIMLGGLGSMVPERRREIAALGMKSIVAGVLATGMTGTIAGVLG
jgi:CNT family concentrative nucleoside transporter